MRLVLRQTWEMFSGLPVVLELSKIENGKEVGSGPGFVLQ